MATQRQICHMHYFISNVTSIGSYESEFQ